MSKDTQYDIEKQAGIGLTLAVLGVLAAVGIAIGLACTGSEVRYYLGPLSLIAVSYRYHKFNKARLLERLNSHE